MMINYADGRQAPVKIGLVDANGVFLLLLDSNETKHYRYSSEADVITALMDDVDKLTRDVTRLEKTCETTANRLEHMTQSRDAARARAEYLAGKLERYEQAG